MKMLPAKLVLATGLVALLTVATPALPGDGDGKSIPLGDPPITIPFEACGVLEIPNDGTDCVMLVTHNGGVYTLEFPGNFEDGDAVCVAGDLAYGNCFTTCDATGCIFNNTITDQFEDSGSYLQGFECGVLLTDDGAQYQINGPLPDGIEMGSFIHVSGTLDADCLSFCNFTCIQNAVVAFAQTQTGVIAPGPQGCPALNIDNGGFVLLEHLGDFTFGDRVKVTGAFNPESQICLPISFPGLEGNSIDGYFQGPGTLGPGPQSCIFFNADNGESFAIDNTGGFGLFDRVYVAGTVHEGSLACFPATVTELRDTTITAFFEGSGTLGVGPQSCTFLHADSGETFAVDSGPFFPGDRVYMTGFVDPESNACFPIGPLAALGDSTIHGLFEGCGQLQPGPQGCLSVATSEGAFFVTGGTQGAELLGGLVRLTGFVIPQFQGCFPVTGDALNIQEIGPCVDGDATLDGNVNVDDIVFVIIRWGTSNPWADLDDSGQVGIDDIVAVVTNWTQ